MMRQDTYYRSPFHLTRTLNKLPSFDVGSMEETVVELSCLASFTDL